MKKLMFLGALSFLYGVGYGVDRAHGMVTNETTPLIQPSNPVLSYGDQPIEQPQVPPSGVIRSGLFTTLETSHFQLNVPNGMETVQVMRTIESGFLAFTTKVTWSMTLNGRPHLVRLEHDGLGTKDLFLDDERKDRVLDAIDGDFVIHLLVESYRLEVKVTETMSDDFEYSLSLVK